MVNFAFFGAPGGIRTPTLSLIEFTECLLWVATSTDRRNTLAKSLGWCFEV